MLTQIAGCNAIICYLRLVHDRELQLHDGTRLIRADRFDEMKSRYGYTDKDLNENHRIFKIHENFFMISTATPPPAKSSAGKDKKQWLTPEMLSLFFYHRLPHLTLLEEMKIIKSFVRILILLTLNYATV